MKLSAFSEFEKAINEGKIKLGEYNPVNLPSSLSPDRIVSFARHTAAQTTMEMLKAYHGWLLEQINCSRQ